MERIQTVTIGTPTILIDCTPQDLRELANKLEATAQRAIPGTSIITPLSKTVSLHMRVRENFKFVGSTYRDSKEVYETDPTH